MTPIKYKLDAQLIFNNEKKSDAQVQSFLDQFKNLTSTIIVPAGYDIDFTKAAVINRNF